MTFWCCFALVLRLMVYFVYGNCFSGFVLIVLWLVCLDVDCLDAFDVRLRWLLLFDFFRTCLCGLLWLVGLVWARFGFVYIFCWGLLLGLFVLVLYVVVSSFTFVKLLLLVYFGSLLFCLFWFCVVGGCCWWLVLWVWLVLFPVVFVWVGLVVCCDLLFGLWVWWWWCHVDFVT